MKKSALARIIIYSIITVILIGLLIFGISTNGNFNNLFKISTKSYDEKGYNTSSQPIDYSINQVKGLDIDWTSGKVIIKNDPKATKVSVSESAKSKIDENESMRYKLEDDGTLSVKYRKSEWNFTLNGGSISKELVVVLPTKVYDKINVDTVSASLEVNGVETKELDVESTSGDISGSDVKAGVLDCESVSGTVDFEKTSVQKLDCDNTSGKITFDGSATSEINVDTTSGNVKISLSKCPTKIDTNSVSASVDILIPKDSQFSAEVSEIGSSFSSNFNTTKNGNNYVCGNGSAKFSFDSVSGGVTINSLS